MSRFWEHRFAFDFFPLCCLLRSGVSERGLMVELMAKESPLGSEVDVLHSKKLDFDISREGDGKIQ